MVGNFFSQLHKKLIAKRTLFFSTLFLLSISLGFGIMRLHINQNIYSILPYEESFQNINKLLEHNKIANQVIFSIDVENSEVEDIATTLMNFEEVLQKETQSLLTDITIQRADVELDTYFYLYKHFPILIDSQDYKNIKGKIAPEKVRTSIEGMYDKLVAPGGFFMKRFLSNDPLNISSEFMLKIQKYSGTDQFHVEDGILFSKDKKKVYLIAKTAFDVSDTKKNEALVLQLHNTVNQWNDKHPKADFFGTFEIAAANSKQVKKDTYLLVIITLVLVIGILIIYYRKISVPIFFTFPAVFGVTFALGTLGFTKGEISAISLATSAVMIGIILDYSFHFFTHLRHTQSITKTIEEISQPLLTGSFTTVTAFLALIFTSSPILQDFGLIAALSLLGAAIFTVVGMPVILKSLSFDYRSISNLRSFSLPQFTKKANYIALFVIFIATGFFLYHSQFIEFDSNLNNLSYHPQELKEKELALTGINTNQDQKVFLFFSGKNKKKLEEQNHQLFKALSKLKEKEVIYSFINTAPFLLPEKVKKEKLNTWKNFWQQHEEEVFPLMREVADSIGFRADMFQTFESWTQNELPQDTNVNEIREALGLNDLIHQENGSTTLLTIATLKKDQVIPVINQLKASLPELLVFNKSQAATNLLDLVKQDFNYILAVSSIIVFITLLLIYGRIELTVLAFIPMLISWIWILGISSLLGLKFNFVNIIVASFIFGLGDDFSIFITDGLLSKYRYGRDKLLSYRSAIILSAITSIIGTGVLIFAEHPAIHSVALISVLGLCCILLISLVLQPILFDLFVLDRIKQKRTPIRLIPILVTIYSFTLFVIGCIILNLILLILKLIPLGEKRRRNYINISICLCAKFLVYSTVYVRKRFIDMENLDFSKPSVIVANHTSFLDILAIIMLNPKVLIMVKEWVYHSPVFGFLIRNAGHLYAAEGAEENLEKIKKRISEGYSVLIFPEGTRSETDKIKRFHKGAFYLAKLLDLDITPILIHGANYVLPKNDFIVHNGTLTLKALPRIKANAPENGKTYRELTKKVSKDFKQAFSELKEEREDGKYFWSRIFDSYVFKGVILEWYLRVKWGFEKKNYDFYHKLIEDRLNILDIGCGYGYMSMYFYFKNNQRKIIGLDYDEEKVTIAQNLFDKSDDIQFLHANIKQMSITTGQDVIFLNDVLHYLAEENQKDVLQQCADLLNDKGILVIRDGVTDFQERHEVTKKTELFSTKILNFNKKEDEFFFFSIAAIKSFAKDNNLSFEMVQQSQKTSNVLFILRK